ncbi:secretin and TonB N-terminal domain-containing protein [Vitiosangium sp. GDMCC 1.1324]|uniref:secretin and TonB N-terminal domain-containing protein n=1 Tax=Vitiosangium sp. (strain GDMCC 1.1324) TaxID=2138576 RepID=UPI000D3B3CC5|nr:secretin and TonB N-terminal domain-containing protein [Vitiosangium sp. GDMCC 1.1324]PTL77125.1 pilus assembly protein PilQ [Vitiosangium sp. GDMCC 1.1324]
MRHARAVFLALALAATPAVAKPPKEGKRISLDVTRANVHDVLRMLADVGRLNLVVSEEVQGSVTLTLRNVPWTEALDVVLASRGLGMEQRGNILRVAPLKTLQEEAEVLARLKQAKEQAAPLRTWLIPVNYAQASELLPHVKALLSPRGSVSVDARTNTLIVTDVEAPRLP